MDVKKPVLVAALFLCVSSCQKNRPIDNVLESNEPSISDKPCSGLKIQNKFIVQWKDGTIESVHWSDYESFKKDFVEPNLDNLKRVEFDRAVQLSEPITPIITNGFSQDWGQKNISANLVWNEGITGQGVVVGVIDTKVDPTHPQLKNQFAINRGEIPDNGIDDDQNGYIDDYYGANFYADPAPTAGQKIPTAEHGSHVSGVIVADPTTGPIKGVAYGAKIIAAPFLNSYGSGSFYDALDALKYVKSRNVKIINASWGGEGCSQILSGTLEEIGRSGILVIVAAGNDHVDIGRVLQSPASFNLFNQITVAANTPYDFLTVFSNYSTRFAHLAAPGEGIVSTIPYSATNGYIKSMSGTSMAAPFVSGAAALVWSAKPQATMEQVRTALLNSVDVSNVYPLITKGRLNVKRAISEIQNSIP